MLIVTGSNGFIGGNLVQALRATGEAAVLSVDHYASLESRDSPTEAAPDELHYPGEADADAYLDKHALHAWLDSGSASGVTGVYHLGANSSTTATDRKAVLANNTEYTAGLWRWCAEQGVPFVYASSASTYGDGKRGFDDEADPHVYQPMHLYGESKHLFDLFALKEQAEDRPQPPRWAGVKYFNVYGPMEKHKKRMASMAYHWYHQVTLTGKAMLFESYRQGVEHGDQQRDFIYVKDAVAATTHFMTADGYTPGVYNVGTGEARTFADLARAVFVALGLEPELEFIPMPEDLRGQYQYFTQATVNKLRAAGFDQPFHELEQGVAEYVAYLRDQQPAAVR